MSVEVEPLIERTYEEWDSYVGANREATCYHVRAWLQAAERAYRMRTESLLARRNGRVVGIQPLFIVRRPLHCHVTSGLFGAYGKVLADDGEARDALVAGAREIVSRVGASYLQLKGLGDLEPWADDLTRVDTSVTAMMTLAEDPQVIWRTFDGDMRTRIRKAQKSG
jgi:hypothetical protein